MKKAIIVFFGLMSFAYAQDSTSVKAKKNPVKEFKVWYDGKSYDADDLDVMCVEDDLSTFANFRWTLTDSTGKSLAMGFLKMTGADYADYISKPNHGQKAVNWVMKELNLVARPNRRQ